jgi:hypothetical protein
MFAMVGQESQDPICRPGDSTVLVKQMPPAKARRQIAVGPSSNAD